MGERGKEKGELGIRGGDEEGTLKGHLHVYFISACTFLLASINVYILKKFTLKNKNC